MPAAEACAHAGVLELLEQLLQWGPAEGQAEVAKASTFSRGCMQLAASAWILLHGCQRRPQAASLTGGTGCLAGLTDVRLQHRDGHGEQAGLQQPQPPAHSCAQGQGSVQQVGPLRCAGRCAARSNRSRRSGADCALAHAVPQREGHVRHGCRGRCPAHAQAAVSGAHRRSMAISRWRCRFEDSERMAAKALPICSRVAMMPHRARRCW